MKARRMWLRRAWSRFRGRRFGLQSLQQHDEEANEELRYKNAIWGFLTLKTLRTKMPFRVF